ncbi:hypothetical protein R5M08_001084 [Providencia rettgeri]|nr:hypothetical protein [Providencia rettgeri]ELR5244672.1 hypothetical protein [Providencia rettgeri]ELS4582974.1 hypothetical protein [Providencia rettgeri]
MMISPAHVVTISARQLEPSGTGELTVSDNYVYCKCGSIAIHKTNELIAGVIFHYHQCIECGKTGLQFQSKQDSAISWRRKNGG